MMPHALYASHGPIKRIVVLSPDTDVFVLALHFSHKFINVGITEIWIRLGLGVTARYVPLHILSTTLGSICRILPACHALTGTDCTSKFGTKAAASKTNTDLLTNFGHDNIELCLASAEQYLVNVWKPSAPTVRLWMSCDINCIITQN